MRMLRIIGRIVLWLFGIVVLAVVVIAVGINTDFGHRSIASLAKLGDVEITGLEGRVPDDLHAQRITVSDTNGVWLEIDALHLSWSPRALLNHEIRAELLSADRVHLSRPPVAGNPAPTQPSPSPSGGFDWRVAVDAVHIPSIELPQATLSLDGHASYQPAGMDVTLAVATPDAAGQGPAALKAHLLGPLTAVVLDATIEGRGLTTQAVGTVDLNSLTGDLSLAVDHPDFAGVSATRLDVKLKGNATDATANAVLARLKLPGAQPDLLGDGPLALDVTWHKAATPEIHAKLTAGATDPAGLRIAADVELVLATMTGRLNFDVDRFAVAGTAASHVALKAEGGAETLDLHGVVTGLEIPGVTPAMLGATPLVIEAKYRKAGSPQLTVALAGDTVALNAEGLLPTDRLALDTHLVLPKLEAFATGIAGHADLTGRIEGAFDNFAVKAKTAVAVTAAGTASTIEGTIGAAGLPTAPTGAVSIKGVYGGQPVTLDATVAIGLDKRPVITIAQAGWQNVAAHGAFTLAADGGLPTGQLQLDARRLPAPTQAGSAHAVIDLMRDGTVPVLKVMTEISGLAVQGTQLARSVLHGTVIDPIGAKPVLKADLALDGVASGAYRQAVRLQLDGPANALAIRLGVTGTATLTAAATLDVATSKLDIASLQGTAQGQTLRLAGPTSITYAPQITLGNTSLALGGSTLQIAGRVSPTLDLTASLRAIPGELVKLADPKLGAEGTLSADARIQGTPQRPSGTIRITGTGLRLREPRGIPAVRLDAQASLEGGLARINATLAASGITQLTVAGVAPIAPGGAYNLTARGRVDLTLLDPFLTGAGAQTRGELALDATLTGTEPRPAGTLTLHHGSVTVPAQGARLSDIEATIRAQPDRVVIESLNAKAGAGTLSGSGSVSLAAPMPIDLKLAARNASPLSSDLLTAKFDADFSLTGALQTAMNAIGTIRLDRADINIPQRLPSSLPVLNVRAKGPPPPPPAPPVPINLDLTLTAPGQVYVRGRGLDAELGGQLHIGGTAVSPRPEGAFTLRRGQFSLAGTTLDFTTGRVGFDGHVPIDPSLNFVATSLTAKVAATLTVTGNASHPRIALSSVPELPQDEVLAQLLFRRSAGELGPLQLAEIAAALAQIADGGGSGGIDPLGAVRKRLGLDVLSVGGTPGSSPTLEAGRNLGHGIYLGAKQSTGGSGSQATVRVDLAKGLRLEADLGVAPAQASTATPGAPPTGNQVGITYEFEY